MFLLKPSIFCFSNFGHLQTQESKDGIYMKIKKHFTCSIRVTFKKLLSWGWRMLDWQLWRLVSLFIAKRQGKQGQEQGRRLPRCPLVSSLRCLLSVCPEPPREQQTLGLLPSLQRCPEKRWQPLLATGQAGADTITLVCLGAHSPRGINQRAANNMRRLRNVIEKLGIVFPA